MKATRCEKCKEFYNSDRYAVCPHCNTAPDEEKKHQSAHSEQKNNNDKGGEKNGFFRLFSKSKLNGFASGEEQSHRELPDKDDTGKYAENSGKEQNVPQDYRSAGKQESQEQEKGSLFLEHGERLAGNIPDINSEKRIEEKEKDRENEEKKSLSEEIADTGSMADVKTEAHYKFSDDIDPAVGWLVAVRGEYKGASFVLISGNNNIGRSQINTIALAKEKTVSRERHASIIFDPVGNKFFIKPGESSGLTYVNNELLLGVKELKHMDKIGLGKAELVFVPFCGESFSWDKYTEE